MSLSKFGSHNQQIDICFFPRQLEQMSKHKNAVCGIRFKSCISSPISIILPGFWRIQKISRFLLLSNVLFLLKINFQV